MDIRQRYVTGILLMVVSVSMQAQSLSSPLKSSIKDDIKRDLLKQVKPSTTLPNSQMRQSTTTTKAIHDESLFEFNKKIGLKSGGSEYEDKYNIERLKESLKYTSTPINKLPDGYVVPVFIGGHWVFMNPNNRVDGLVVPSGMDLSGGGRKKMSNKAKNILEHVFGMKVED